MRYVRPDEMHQAFNFDFLGTPWIAADCVAVIERSLVAADSVGAPSTWVLSNHDVVRHATRLGYARRDHAPPTASAPTTPSPTASSACSAPGRRRPLMLALPG